MESKKGFVIGYEYILSFFLLALIFIFVIAIYDFTLVEFHNPVSELLMNATLENNNNTNDTVYIAMQEQHDWANNNTLPFNYIFMFFVCYLVIVALIDVSKRKKQELSSLFLQTVGGIIFLIFIIKLILINIIEWFQVQFINAIFDDIVFLYLPFYQTLVDHWAISALIFAVLLTISNWYFGE